MRLPNAPLGLLDPPVPRPRGTPQPIYEPACGFLFHCTDVLNTLVKPPAPSQCAAGRHGRPPPVVCVGGLCGAALPGQAVLCDRQAGPGPQCGTSHRQRWRALSEDRPGGPAGEDQTQATAPGPQAQRVGAAAPDRGPADPVAPPGPAHPSQRHPQISRALANKAHTVVIEDLHTQGMTRTARGTTENPGSHVRAKAGLNRVILATNWAQLAQRLAYKCGQEVTVELHGTSQTCHRCGFASRDNRQSQARFACLACGLTMHADHNAAINIWVRHGRTVARGTGATARREAFPLGTSLTREHDMLQERWDLSK